jgi:hypothetical protein
MEVARELGHDAPIGCRGSEHHHGTTPAGASEAGAIGPVPHGGVDDEVRLGYGRLIVVSERRVSLDQQAS